MSGRGESGFDELERRMAAGVVIGQLEQAGLGLLNKGEFPLAPGYVLAVPGAASSSRRSSATRLGAATARSALGRRRCGWGLRMWSSPTRTTTASGSTVCASVAP